MEDDKLESFFREMKMADESLHVPPFPKQKEPRKLWPVFLYVTAAAIVAILITVRYVAPTPAHEASPEVEIEMFIGEDNLQSHSLLEPNQQDLSTWESPTDFLSEDY